MKKLNWVSFGCGVIANQLAQALSSEGRKLYGVYNRTYEKAVDFSKKYGIETVYESFDDVLKDENVDVIYISTPHNTHIGFLRKALESGKHVLCEKSITLNSAELNEAVEIAKKNKVVLAEAMTIYHMPIYKKLKQMMDENTFGPLQMIQMNFGSAKEYDMNNRFFSKNLAGGALLDIGVYAISFIRWFMKSSPTNILSQVKFAPSGVDEQAGILLMNDDGEMATITMSLNAKQPKRATVIFRDAYVEIFEYPRGQKAKITYTKDGRTQEVEAGSTDEALVYEVRDMEEAVNIHESGLNHSRDNNINDIIHLDFTKDVMGIMTNIREGWGLVYPEEE